MCYILVQVILNLCVITMTLSLITILVKKNIVYNNWIISYNFCKLLNACMVPKCPTNLNVRQILFFSKSVIMVKEIILISIRRKYLKSIFSKTNTQSRT